MALSVKEADDHLIHAIGGPLVGISNQRILDEAGSRLYAQEPWVFLKRPSRALDLTALQEYIPLAADFGSIQSLNYATSTYISIQATSMVEIARMREIGYPDDGLLHYSTDFRVNATTGKPSPSLEIYPTPTTTQVGALLLYYRAGWVKIVDSGDLSNTYISGIPEFLEGIYLDFVRAVAIGRQTNAIGAAIRTVIESDDFRAAVKYDRTIQWEHGPMSGGGLECAMDSPRGVWLLRNAPAAPSP